MDIKGKVVASHKVCNSELTITFEDGTYLQVELDRYNTSCSCHPEYEYSLDVTLNG